jgi:hypothetical protein
MNSIRIVDAVHADRAARLRAEAEAHRLARRSGPAGRRRIRRAVGRSIVAIGARIAADPAPERLQPTGPR